MEARLCIIMFDATFRYKEFHGTGVLGVTINLLLEQMRGINYTVVREPGYGTMIDKETQQYGGCIGSMQKNESDFMLIVEMLTIPVVGPNLTHTVVDGFGRMGIVSAYNKTNIDDGSRTQVLDMVFSFSPGLWILLTFSIIVLFMLLHAAIVVRGEGLYAKYASRMWTTRRILVSGKRKRRRSASGWIVLACILKQNSSCSSCDVNFGPISICGDWHHPPLHAHMRSASKTGFPVFAFCASELRIPLLYKSNRSLIKARTLSLHLHHSRRVSPHSVFLFFSLSRHLD